MPKVSPKPVMSYSLMWLVTPGLSSPKLDPFMTLSFMSLPVIPALRLTTRGVIDVIKQQYI